MLFHYPSPHMEAPDRNALAHSTGQVRSYRPLPVVAWLELLAHESALLCHVASYAILQLFTAGLCLSKHQSTLTVLHVVRIWPVAFRTCGPVWTCDDVTKRAIVIKSQQNVLREPDGERGAPGSCLRARGTHVSQHRKTNREASIRAP